MPIIANCPNPACGKALSVADQYAGMQGQCPFCKTVFTFPNAPPPPPVMPSPYPPVQPAPTPSAPPPPPPISEPQWRAAPGLPAKTFGAGQLDLINLILISAGLFFLLMLFIGILCPWVSTPGGTRSGLNVAIGIILFIFTLLIMGAVTTAFVMSLVMKNPRVVNLLLSYSVTAAAWLGTLTFLSALAGLFRPWALGEGAKFYDDPATREAVRAAVSKGFGIWFSFFASLGVAGVFGFMAFNRPPELPNPNPFVRRWLLLVCALGSAAFIGLLVLIIHII
jgi:hypothetical protein